VAGSEPSPRQLLDQLLELSAEERAALEAEEWERAVEVRGRFDTAYAHFEQVADVTPLAAADVPLLQGLIDSHTEAMRLATALRDKAAGALNSIAEAEPVIGAYAPMGASHKPGPRFIDHDA
jgi:hypothetical protein